MRAVRRMGFRIALHTGGAYPERLAEVLPLVDWIGLDVKSPVAEYASVTGVERSGAAALASLDLVVGANVAYEVRTTVHPALTPAEGLVRLASELAARGVTRWVLQAFRANGCADAKLVASARGRRVCDDALLARLRERIPATASRC
jgi:pyruvate formate lyase activating enzyme